MPTRTERWTNAEQQTAMVDVQADETVVVTYDLFSQMLQSLGFTKQDDDDGAGHS